MRKTSVEGIRACLFLFFLGLFACKGEIGATPDLGADAGFADFGAVGGPDAGAPEDLGTIDDGGSIHMPDVGDVGPVDLGMDAGFDTGADLGADAGESPDGGMKLDGGAGVLDAGEVIPVGADWIWSPMAQSQYRSAGEALWTGDEMIIIGGRGGGGASCAGETLYYNPALDSWRIQSGTYVQMFFSAAFGGEQALVSGGVSCGLSGMWASTRRMIFLPREDRMESITDPLPGARMAHSTVWTGQEFLIWGGTEGPEPCVDPCVDDTNRGLRFDPATKAWTPLSTVGAPPDGFAVWADSAMLVWGTGQGARYDPLADTWTPITPSAIAPDGSRRGMVWTGAALFVYGSAGSALYDPVMDTWQQVSAAAAPSSMFARAFWTGAEVLVIGEADAGHYDPISDAWTPAPTDGAVYPDNGYAAWSGQELIVYNRVESTGVESARYGPRLTSTPGCDGGAAPLQVQIANPTDRTVASDTLSVTADITNDFGISAIEWFFDGTSQGALGGPTGTIDVSAYPYGTYNLSVTVTDLMGNTACRDRTIFVDRPPTLSVLGPEDDRSYRSSIRAQAVCQDDSNRGCSIRVRQGATVLAVGQRLGSALDESFDVSALDGAEYNLTFEAFDHRGQRTSQTVVPIVVNNTNLALHAQAGGTICDAAADRILFEDPSGVLIERDVVSGTETQHPVMGSGLDCARSFLVPGGVVVITQNRAHLSTSGVTTWVSSETLGEGDWVTTVGGGDITLRNVVTGASEVVSSDWTTRFHDLAENGAVVYRGPADEFFFKRQGQAAVSIGVVPGPTAQEPRTDGSAVVLRERIAGPDYRLHLWEGAALSELVPVTDLWNNTGPTPHQDYDIAGGFLSYSAPDVLGSYILWQRDGAANTTAITPAGGASGLAGVSTDGRVVYVEGASLVLWNSASGPVTIGSTLGQVLWRDAQLFVVYGKDVYRATD